MWPVIVVDVDELIEALGNDRSVQSVDLVFFDTDTDTYTIDTTVATATVRGTAFAIDGDTIVVGATHVGVDGHTAQGAAYVFELSGGIWTQQAKIIAENEADWFGASVAISGNRRLSQFGYRGVQREGYWRNESLPANVRHPQAR